MLLVPGADTRSLGVTEEDKGPGQLPSAGELLAKNLREAVCFKRKLWSEA